MLNLVESVKESGVIAPAIIRLKDDGRYEMISGHRRKRAAELAGMQTLRCEVVDLTRDEATIFMVESNFHRSTILPSEKAFAYKMRLDAIKRQGFRSDLISGPVEPKYYGRSNEKLSHEINESVSQIKRYIRLTNLVPELLEMVDQKDKIVLRGEILNKLIPKSVSEAKREAYVCEALEFYRKEKNRERRRNSLYSR